MLTQSIYLYHHITIDDDNDDDNYNDDDDNYDDDNYDYDNYDYDNYDYDDYDDDDDYYDDSLIPILGNGNVTTHINVIDFNYNNTYQTNS